MWHFHFIYKGKWLKTSIFPTVATWMLYVSYQKDSCHVWWWITSHVGCDKSASIYLLHNYYTCILYSWVICIRPFRNLWINTNSTTLSSIHTVRAWILPTLSIFLQKRMPAVFSSVRHFPHITVFRTNVRNIGQTKSIIDWLDLSNFTDYSNAAPNKLHYIIIISYCFTIFRHYCNF